MSFSSSSFSSRIKEARSEATCPSIRALASVCGSTPFQSSCGFTGAAFFERDGIIPNASDNLYPSRPSSSCVTAKLIDSSQSSDSPSSFLFHLSNRVLNLPRCAYSGYSSAISMQVSSDGRITATREEHFNDLQLLGRVQARFRIQLGRSHVRAFSTISVY